MDGDDEAEHINSKINVGLSRKTKLRVNGIDLDNTKPLKATTDSTLMTNNRDNEPEKPMMIRDGFVSINQDTGLKQTT